MKRIFNIRAVERFGVDTWHKDVRFFDLIDETGEVAAVSISIFMRAKINVAAHGWMIVSAENVMLTVQFKTCCLLTCNFNAPIGDKPALFTHDEDPLLPRVWSRHSPYAH